MTKLGMDVDEVERLARAIQGQADRLSATADEINRIVTHIGGLWHGREAQRFIHEWWPQHRSHLRSAAQQIHGLGQSALNNAQDQRRTSATDGSGSSGGSPGAGLLHLIDRAAGTDPTIDGKGLHIEHPLFEAKHGYDEARSVAGSVGPVDLEAHGGLFAGAKSSGTATFDAGPDGLWAGVDLNQKAGMEATAGASAALGMATLGASGSAFAGVKASESAKIGVSRDSIGAQVGASAFAGADATGTVSANLGGAEGSITGHAMAGVGIEAEAGASISMNEVDLHFKLGASLGIGAGIEPDIKIHPRQVIDNLSHLALWS